MAVPKKCSSNCVREPRESRSCLAYVPSLAHPKRLVEQKANRLLFEQMLRFPTILLASSPRSLRKLNASAMIPTLPFRERSHRGLVHSLGKRAYRKVSEVRILSPPPRRTRATWLRHNKDPHPYSGLSHRSYSEIHKTAHCGRFYRLPNVYSGITFPSSSPAVSYRDRVSVFLLYERLNPQPRWT